ncbi:MAG: menaquinone biosynthesis decarboxylase [Bacteroidota bacterium]
MKPPFHTLPHFLHYLESIGELQRIRVEVDPVLEITEIARRSQLEGRPALFFERVKGSPYPLAINIFSSDRRIELALGKHPQQLGEELITFIEKIMPLKPITLVKSRKMVGRFYKARPERIKKAPSQNIVEDPDLNQLPILKCWPGDGGRFITLPQVFTCDPRNGKRNVGMYRLHVFDKSTTGIHWQIQKGGGFHYFQAEKLERPLEVAIAIGTDPAFVLATIAALPEGIDEVMFAGFLRNSRTRMTRAKTLSIDVPAEAEFILEGIVQPEERRNEGPFGDHFGHYSAAAPFPVFHVKAVTHRENPIYAATVVGKPPMEDKFLGDATQQILGPLAKLLQPEVTDLWAYYEAGFHNLLVISVEQRYQKEAMKTALGLLGTQQLALTKVAITVGEHINPRDFDAVLREIRRNFNPHSDFLMLPKVPLDTLDFTSYRMNLGSKMIIDATPKQRVPGRQPKLRITSQKICGLDRRIIETVIKQDTLAVVKVKHEGNKIVDKLVRNPLCRELSIIAAVSEDVDIKSDVDILWGIFTRFDAARDVVFTSSKLVGIDPVHEGILGIDATWKDGYPKPLTMSEKIMRRVDRRWNEYWILGAK